jgi:hypothetical protein
MTTSGSQRANLLPTGLLRRRPLVESGGDGPVYPTVRGNERENRVTLDEVVKIDMRG